MSRGFGKVQRRILDLLYRFHHTGSGLGAGVIAEMVYDAPPGIAAAAWDAGAPAREEAVRRALRGLRERGVVDGQWLPAFDTEGGDHYAGSLQWQMTDALVRRIRAAEETEALIHRVQAVEQERRAALLEGAVRDGSTQESPVPTIP